jgi:hypothetical protein
MRDDFLPNTVNKLGERVGLLCSNPSCRAPTKGPHTSADKATNLGVAAHIHAAASGGPRYDADQTPAERSSIENGLWLCWTCSVLIDKDAARFPANLLRAWKVAAEEDAMDRLGKPALVTRPTGEPSLILKEIKVDRANAPAKSTTLIFEASVKGMVPEPEITVVFPVPFKDVRFAVRGPGMVQRNDLFPPETSADKRRYRCGLAHLPPAQQIILTFNGDGELGDPTVMVR